MALFNDSVNKRNCALIANSVVGEVEHLNRGPFSDPLRESLKKEEAKLVRSKAKLS